MTTARTLTRVAAGLVALCIGNGGKLLAAASPTAVAPGERTVVEKGIEKIGQKIDDQIDAAVGEEAIAKIEDAHEDQERFFGEFFVFYNF